MDSPTRVPKFILLILSLLLSSFSMLFVAIEVINLLSQNYSVFLHPFNGLQRYFNRSLSFLFILAVSTLSIFNIIKTTPIKTRILSISLVSIFVISFSFLAYLDLFIFLIFSALILVCIIFHFYIYLYIPNRKTIKQILTKNNNQ